MVLVHCWDALIDEDGEVLQVTPYVLDTANPSPSARLRSLLYTPGGNDFYGVIRTDALHRVGPHGTYYNADRTIVSALCLQGPFVQVPEVLYWRREHANRASRAGDHRAVAAALGPDRANRWRHPMARMYVEYVYGFVQAIRRAPLTSAERNRCLAEVARWFWSCLPPGRSRQARAGRAGAGPARPRRRRHGHGSSDMGATTLRVATYGYFGMGNLGNEGSLAAFLAYMRDAHPEAAVELLRGRRRCRAP